MTGTVAANGAARHTPVLLKEVVQYLLGGGVPREKTVIVDATFGSGGHSRALFGSCISVRAVRVPIDSTIYPRIL